MKKKQQRLRGKWIWMVQPKPRRKNLHILNSSLNWRRKLTMFVQFVAILEYPKHGGDVVDALYGRTQHAQNLTDQKISKSASNVMGKANKKMADITHLSGRYFPWRWVMSTKKYLLFLCKI